VALERTSYHAPVVRGGTTLAALPRLLDDLYAAALKPELYPAFVAALRRELNAGYVGLVSKTAAAVPTVTDGAERGWLEDYRAHFAKVDPYCDRVQERLQVGQACSTEEILPRRQLLETEFYVDFLSRVGLRDGIVGMLDRTNQATGMLTILFPRDERVERDPRCAIVSELVPHIRRSLEMCRLLTDARLETQLAQGLLDELSCAAFVVTPQARVLRTNRLADELLKTADGVISRPEGLAASHPADHKALRQEISRALSLPGAGASRGLIRLRRASLEAPLIAVVGPLTSRVAVPLGLADARVLVLIRDPLRTPVTSARAISRSLGLTAAESKLVDRLVQGSSVRTAAEALGISAHTARSQLKSAFAKTSTHRQSELVKLVMLVAAGR